jgi:hypothetical protein
MADVDGEYIRWLVPGASRQSAHLVSQVIPHQIEHKWSILLPLITNYSYSQISVYMKQLKIFKFMAQCN